MPYVEALPYQDPAELFSHFADMPGSVLLDSAHASAELGRYSFIALDPFRQLTAKNGVVQGRRVESPGLDPLEVVQQELKQYPLAKVPELPPFQGGIAGFFAYDLCHAIECLPKLQPDEEGYPDLALGFYDLVLAFDHQQRQAWIISSGLPFKDSVTRCKRAKLRCQWVKRKLLEQVPWNKPNTMHLPASAIQSNFTASKYLQAVQKVIEYIYAGDIFEANIAQRFSAPWPQGLSPWHLYRRLRTLNPAPFAAYLHFGDTILASASPERFLKLMEQKVETRPIKGTCPRGATPLEDERKQAALLASTKDRAENMMIVDLLRNDLSKVCLPQSVTVLKLCGLESYATLHHLVSVVEGQLKPGLDAFDLLKAAFPGGSITGAPKVRAMEIIAEIEPTRRGPYCGALGYINFNGAMDTSIIIRTFVFKGQQVTFQAGGAIVADSDPEAEYEETLTKAQALRQCLTGGV